MLKPYNGFTGAQRDAAQREINKAWAAGRRRPSLCAACGQEGGVIDAHLEDYSKPLDYIETCFICHMMIHCRFRNPQAWDRYRDLLHDGARWAAFGTRDFPTFKACFLNEDPVSYVVEYGPRRETVWLDELRVAS